ncbi:prephenate dehydrogenase/arogenate dehydrogenase family protein [Opitutales bacterium]|nr:prephenate dehydrogenase/arogenate dehydrogenase family protein [Opitutales bacterium]
MFNQITIIGPGLLGTSLGMAIKAKGLAREINVWARRPEVREACRHTDWCDADHSEISEAVKGSDFVVVCTPVRHIEAVLSEIARVVPSGCVVTDVGSVKGAICQAADKVFTTSDATFVGSHPMAGSEKAGMENASPDLFDERPCFVTSGKDISVESLELVSNFWQAIGMSVTITTPNEHDEIVAHLSHLPHAVASGLCHLLSNKPSTWGKLAGQGLRDTTRIASGNPQLWEEIFLLNREAVLSALESFEETCGLLRAALHTQNDSEIRSWLNAGKEYRDELKRPKDT